MRECLGITGGRNIGRHGTGQWRWGSEEEEGKCNPLHLDRCRTAKACRFQTVGYKRLERTQGSYQKTFQNHCSLLFSSRSRSYSPLNCNYWVDIKYIFFFLLLPNLNAVFWITWFKRPKPQSLSLSLSPQLALIKIQLSIHVSGDFNATSCPSIKEKILLKKKKSKQMQM